MSKDLPTGSDQFREAMQSRKCIGSGATGSRGGFYPDLFKVDSPDNKADWSVWKLKPTVGLWEACYLSLNLNPKISSELHNGADTAKIYIGSISKARAIVDLHKSVSDRIEVAESNLVENGGTLNPFKTTRSLYGNFSTVRLSEFGAWAKSMGWDLPPEFPIEQLKTVNENVTNSPKERNSMLAVIYGMAISKYGYKPEAARNAATGENTGSISADLQKLALTCSGETIGKYLKEAHLIYGGGEPKS